MHVKGKLIGIFLLVYSFSAIAQEKNDSDVPAAINQNSIAVDNSHINMRDRDSHALIPQNQPSDWVDIRLLRDVRRAVIRDKSLSLNGHNVKILVTNNVIVLRGPVDTEAEKAKIGEIATQIVGVSGVDNELEIKAR